MVNPGRGVQSLESSRVSVFNRRMTRSTFIGPLLAMILSVPAAAPGAADVAVDLELILMADGSGSIDEEEFALQRQGYARALRDPRVLNAIRYGRLGRIALSYVEWSGPAIQVPIVPWTVIRDAVDIELFATTLKGTPREVYFGGTAPGNAILYGVVSLAENGFAGRRRIIDVSGDDRAKDGVPSIMGRDAAVSRGITVNGLPILEGLAWLGAYFRDNIIGGPGAFYVPALTFRDFEVAVRKKLIREIAGGPGPLPVPDDGPNGHQLVCVRGKCPLMATSGPFKP